MRRRITSHPDCLRAIATRWVLAVFVVVPFAAPAQAMPSTRDVRARLTPLPRSPVQPAKVERDPAVDPQPIARPIPQQGDSSGSLAACVAGPVSGAARAASNVVLVRPGPARTHDGATWRVGFGWRAPPVLD